MKVPVALLSLAFAGAVVAQDGLGLPKCAESCATSFLNGGIGDCGRDVECICKNKSFLGEIACCLAGDCSADDQTTAVSVAANLCKAFGVTDLPTTVACSTASGTASTTAASASASATDSGTSSAPTGTANNAAQSTTSQSTNFGPRPTAAAGLGAIGGIMAAVALL
ncbi:hypothetical protein C8A01DRAFT_45453 [Parachaetomium inaequale]|uniref:CFEM domain-containing protein n=1 Tax=Parachaetomium inaequale TaxID=2588326 RepID=A0AAN6STC5_9PEZI|nr:hypothetical protein C8A01DRAFT_45453 [Parachaetomium inaequale]